MPEVPYHRQPADFSTPVRYAYGPDSHRRRGVPEGTITEHRLLASSVFPGTSRRWWVYLPAGHATTEAAVMVFQDGWLYLDPNGEIRAGVVFDNLIDAGEMPPTVGVFVDPGEPANRNAEYDPLDDAYATFVLSEIIPLVAEQCRIATDPDRWGIAGGSSGGSCAFTAAWLRPDRFRRVLSFLGSFAQIPGGNPYPELIRASERKPLRVFMQAATRDLNHDQPDLNWLSENLQVAAALSERGYDLRFVLGDGGHDTNQAGAILPDAMRWLWRTGP
jgi:enterochelin esterase-like enzyme